jgi:hypothetical protein
LTRTQHAAIAQTGVTLATTATSARFTSRPPLSLSEWAAQAAARRKQLIALPGMRLATASSFISPYIPAAVPPPPFGMGSTGCCSAPAADRPTRHDARSPPPAAPARYPSQPLLSFSARAAQAGARRARS